MGDEQQRWAGIMMWGLALPALMVSLGLRLWLLDYAFLGHFEPRATFDAIRSTLFMLAVPGCLGMAMAKLARSRAQFNAGLFLWASLISTTIVIEIAGTLFAAETGAALNLEVVLLGFAPGIWTLLVASTPTVFQMAAIIAVTVCFGVPLVWFVREPPKVRPDWTARSWAIAAAVCVLLAIIPVGKGPDARVAAAKSPAVAVFVDSVSSALGLGTSEGESGSKRTLGVAERTDAKPKNIVIILMESTRRDATTPYRPDRNTTPVLAELAKESLVMERAYVPMPSTSKALVASLCGIYPDPTRQFTAAVPGRIPQRCLPHLLQEVGYDSLFLQPVMGAFEFYDSTVDNLGFIDALHQEQLDTDGFIKINYLGYEESVMLKPSEDWVSQRAGKRPFLLTYLTVSPHHDYTIPKELEGEWHSDPTINRYLSTVAFVDKFIGEVIEMLKRQGVWDETVLLVLGDHGEAFGEHHVLAHNTVLYEEGLTIPLLLRVPQMPASRVQRMVSQLDMLPTLIDVAGLRLKTGDYDGQNLLSAPENRRFTMYCLFDQQCMGTLDWPYKYIYNFDIREAELYHLGDDPGEKSNIIADHAERAEEMRMHVAEEYMRIRREHGTRMVYDPR